ncbi:hypothetical protein JCM8547_001072 [Rhodosporidiobolus lusitaniae]
MSTPMLRNDKPPCCTINDLPAELKKQIVEVCAEQDERFRAWMEKEGPATLAMNLKANKWMHGKSVSALFRVSRTWSMLAAPHLFRSLKVLKVDLRFKFLIAQSRLRFFYELEFDCTSEQTVRVLPFLHGMSGNKDAAAFTATGLRHLNAIEELSVTFSPLKTILSTVEASSSSLRRLTFTLAIRGGTRHLADMLSTTKHLEHLTLICSGDYLVDWFTLTDVIRQTSPAPPLLHLTLQPQFLHSSHLEFAQLFSHTLRHFSLVSSYVDFGDGWAGFPPPLFANEVFPLVTTFTFGADEDIAGDTLSSVKPVNFPSLRILKIKMRHIKEWTPDDSPL